jgi:hypothetical protein
MLDMAQKGAMTAVEAYLIGKFVPQGGPES